MIKTTAVQILSLRLLVVADLAADLAKGLPPAAAGALRMIQNELETAAFDVVNLCK